MGVISIKINIADRVYPLKVDVAEEEIVRKAAKDINERIKTLTQNYEVRDKQDLLSMCVLHYATTALKLDNKNLIPDEGITEKIMELDHLLDAFLAKQ
ncbi:cell division protein ZapA [Solitalea koreensis]|uniref:Cell division protein ZapA n=1 Tax=Solitalea koreensis TaxID=543615 RepID=A0A521DTA2_9SPHI|nr:cell division protein ZapA [Solitalea koreensis]SMO74949.1 cell division protein ZapA [Solitalea koreensis]